MFGHAQSSKASVEAGLAGMIVGIALAILVAWSPRILALLGGLGAAAALACLWRDPDHARREAGPTPETVALYAFAGFSLLSAFWSADVRESLTKPLYLVLLIAGVHAGAVVFARQGDRCRQAVGTWLIVVLLVGIGLAAFESVSGQLLSRKIYTAFPALRKGIEEHVTMVDGIATTISETNIKRRVGAFTLTLAPAALLILTIVPAARRAVSLAAFTLVAAAMIYASPHQSSWMSGLLATATLALALYSRVAASRTLQFGFAAWVMLAIPIVWAAHKAELHKASWVPNSARHRVVIWNTTANEALKAPILGVGANATRKIFEDREAASPSTERDDGTYIKGLTRHAHNAYVQIWYELGALGALLLALAGVVVVRGIGRLPAIAQPFAYAQFAATAAVMSSSYGIWQVWFLASIAIGALALLVAAQVPGGAPAHPGEGPQRERDPTPATAPMV